MTTDQHDAYEPEHTSSPTADALEHLQLYGYRPFDEPDARPLPEGRLVTGAVADIFDAFVATLTDTRLEPDLEGLLWSQVNLFHRAAQRVERELDDNESAQKRSQSEQDGSELRSVELERLIAEGLTLIERRNALELFRDTAIALYERDTGSSWRPRSSSLVSHRTLTAAVVESRDYLAAKRRAEIEPLLPPGPKIVFTGGADCNDYKAIWAALDTAREKHPEMALVHTAYPTGADKIAADWASNRKVTAIPYPPNFVKHSRAAAPFKRNEAIIEMLPVGIIVFGGRPIQQNLADKADKAGIPVWPFAGAVTRRSRRSAKAASEATREV